MSRSMWLGSMNGSSPCTLRRHETLARLSKSAKRVSDGFVHALGARAQSLRVITA
jgi:hypothetical protein